MIGTLLLLLRSSGAPTPRFNIAQIPTASLGTGKKILVLYNGGIQERVASEGTPIILDNGTLRCLLATETLQS